MNISGIILAGGRSTRMGWDKTLMPIHADTLIEKTVKELRKIVDEIIIASSHSGKYNLPQTTEVPDIYTDAGPLGGIHAGLLAAKNKYSFVVAGDMPLFTANLVTCLQEKNDGGFDVIVPEIEEFLEPLCAIYSKNCLTAIEQYLNSDARNVCGFYNNVKVLKISEQDLSDAGLENIKDIFYNLNTPEDYRKLLKYDTHD